MAEIPVNAVVDPMAELAVWYTLKQEAAAAVLRRAGILPALLESKLARVTQTQFARLMTALVRHHRDGKTIYRTQPDLLSAVALKMRLQAGAPIPPRGKKTDSDRITTP